MFSLQASNVAAAAGFNRFKPASQILQDVIRTQFPLALKKLRETELQNVAIIKAVKQGERKADAHVQKVLAAEAPKTAKSLSTAASEQCAQAVHKECVNVVKDVLAQTVPSATNLVSSLSENAQTASDLCKAAATRKRELEQVIETAEKHQKLAQESKVPPQDLPPLPTAPSAMEAREMVQQLEKVISVAEKVTQVMDETKTHQSAVAKSHGVVREQNNIDMYAEERGISIYRPEMWESEVIRIGAVKVVGRADGVDLTEGGRVYEVKERQSAGRWLTDMPLSKKHHDLIQAAVYAIMYQRDATLLEFYGGKLMRSTEMDLAKAKELIVNADGIVRLKVLEFEKKVHRALEEPERLQEIFCI